MRVSTYRFAAVLVAVLAATALGAGVTASQPDRYAVEQGTACFELTPVTDQTQTVEEFYGYTTAIEAETNRYSANTPIGLEYANDGASSLFLYRGTDGLSLVVLNGGINDTDGAGEATMEFTGLPEDGTWTVRDDPANLSLETWDRNGTETQTVDWGWRGRWTDGGAFHGGLGGEFSVDIDARFNEDANPDPLEPGNVTQWRALSAGETSLLAFELDMNRSVTVRSGGCE